MSVEEKMRQNTKCEPKTKILVQKKLKNLVDDEPLNQYNIFGDLSGLSGEGTVGNPRIWSGRP